MAKDFGRAMEGLALIAQGLRLLDENFGALDDLQQSHLDQSVLENCDAVGVERLRAALIAMKGTDNA